MIKTRRQRRQLSKKSQTAIDYIKICDEIFMECEMSIHRMIESTKDLDKEEKEKKFYAEYLNSKIFEGMLLSFIYKGMKTHEFEPFMAQLEKFVDMRLNAEKEKMKVMAETEAKDAILEKEELSEIEKEELVAEPELQQIATILEEEKLNESETLTP